MRRRPVIVAIAAVLVTGAAIGLVWFQPWKLWIDHRVEQALPAAAALAPGAPTASGVPTASSAATASSTSPSSSPSSPSSARLLSSGQLISHEHATRGVVSVVLQPDGSRVLAIANLTTSNGPDLKVWLSDAPVLAGSDGWHVFDDPGRQHLSLGSLKGNLGDQVYSIPADADLSHLRSVTIWCDRFNVSFGAAALLTA